MRVAMGAWAILKSHGCYRCPRDNSIGTAKPTSALSCKLAANEASHSAALLFNWASGPTRFLCGPKACHAAVRSGHRRSGYMRCVSACSSSRSTVNDVRSGSALAGGLCKRIDVLLDGGESARRCPLGAASCASTCVSCALDGGCSAPMRGLRRRARRMSPASPSLLLKQIAVGACGTACASGRMSLYRRRCAS